MQRSLLKAATDERVPAGYRAQCARAWDCLEERKRILRNKPLPGQLRPDLEQKKKKPKAWTPGLLDPTDTMKLSSKESL